MYSVSESSIAKRVWKTRHSQVPPWQVFSLDIISDDLVFLFCGICVATKDVSIHQ